MEEIQVWLGWDLTAVKNVDQGFRDLTELKGQRRPGKTKHGKIA